MPEGPKPERLASIELSISAIARATSMDRRTIANRLDAVEAMPCNGSGKSALYSLRDVIRALACDFGSDDEVSSTDRLNLARARESDLNSARKELELKVQAGQLIPESDVRTELAKVVNDTAQFLMTLPDILERDVGLSGRQVAKAHELVAKHRTAMYEKLAE